MPTPVGPTPRQAAKSKFDFVDEETTYDSLYNAPTQTQWKFAVTCMTTKVAEVQGYGDLAKAQAEAKALMDGKSCGSKPKLLHVARLGAASEKMAGQWKNCSPCPGAQGMAELEASMK